MRSSRERIILTAASWCAGLLMLWAGIAKLRDPSLAEAMVRAHGAFPPQWVPLLVGWISFAEILTGCWLLAGWRPRGAALSFLLLMSLFLFAAIDARTRGLEAACGCFGDGWMSRLPAGWVLFRDGLLFAVALWLYLRRLALDCASLHGKMHP